MPKSNEKKQRNCGGPDGLKIVRGFFMRGSENMSKKLTILFVVMALCATAQSQTPITVTNPSFESGTTGWTDATVGSDVLYAAPDGSSYASRKGTRDGATTQLTGHTVLAGETYTLTVWARSINNVRNDDATPVEVKLYYGSTTINSVTQDVNPVRLLGDPRIYANDDGGNVWLDAGYRMEFSDEIFYQLDTDDPLADPWTYYVDPDYGPGLAVGPIITPQGLKAVYSFTATEQPPWYQEIWYRTASGSPPDYTWANYTPVLSHAGSVEANPWMIDPHLFYDGDTGKLWMSWGGGETLWVSEVDPTDGMLINHPADIEFDTHSPGTHINSD